MALRRCKAVSRINHPLQLLSPETPNEKFKMKIPQSMYFPWYFKHPCLHPLPWDEQMVGSEVLKRCCGTGNCGEQLGMSPTHPHNPNSRGRSRNKSGSAAASTRDAGAGDADAGDAGGGDADAVHEITAGLRKHKPTHPTPCPSPRAAPRHHTTRAQCREVSASPLALPPVRGHSLTADTSRHHKPCSPSPACSWHVSEVSP